MTKDDFVNWLNRFDVAWREKKVQILSELFAQDIEYFESPFVKINSLDTVLRQWKKDLQNQSEIKVESTPILFSDNVGVANWQASFKANGDTVTLNGIYYLEFDDRNLCKTFKQWWVKK